MVIEARQRSPLGACYRTPLDAFGQGAVVPELFWYGRVMEVADYPLPGGGRFYFDDAPVCGVEKSTVGNGAPTTHAYKHTIHFTNSLSDPDLRPVDGSYIGWIVTGESSGTVWTIGADTPVYKCINPSNGRRTHWSIGTWTDEFDEESPDVSMIAYFSGLTGGWLFAAQWVGHDVNAYPFQLHEDVSVTIP